MELSLNGKILCGSVVATLAFVGVGYATLAGTEFTPNNKLHYYCLGKFGFGDSIQKIPPAAIDTLELHHDPALARIRSDLGSDIDKDPDDAQLVIHNLAEDLSNSPTDPILQYKVGAAFCNALEAQSDSGGDQDLRLKNRILLEELAWLMATQTPSPLTSSYEWNAARYSISGTTWASNEPLIAAGRSLLNFDATDFAVKFNLTYQLADRRTDRDTQEAIDLSDSSIAHQQHVNCWRSLEAAAYETRWEYRHNTADIQQSIKLAQAVIASLPANSERRQRSERALSIYQQELSGSIR